MVDGTSYRLIGACPSSRKAPSSREYIGMLNDAVEWAEQDGWEALLIYTSNGLADPWVIAQLILQNSAKVSPLVAVQPFYAHPFSIANKILTLALLFNRPVYMNYVAGDYPLDREALCDDIHHDKRYTRLVEYGVLINRLLSSRTPVSAIGEFYKANGLSLFSSLPASLLPRVLVSGSSAAGMHSARTLNACAIQYPKPSYEYQSVILDPAISFGLRIGIVARESRSEAWAVAKQRFPDSQDGAFARKFASAASDSVWVKELGKRTVFTESHPYWLGPFQNSLSACPFLVGSLDEVAGELAAYMRAGFRTFLLETPENRADSEMISEVFRLAGGMSKVERG